MAEYVLQDGDHLLDPESSLPDGLIAPSSAAEEKTHKAKHNKQEKASQQAPGPTPGLDFSIDVNHPALSGTGGVAVGAATVGDWRGAADGVLPGFSPKIEGAIAGVFETAPQLTAGAGNKPGTTSLLTETMTVTADKADYAPGDTATFTVTGVSPGSSVTFQVADLTPGANGVADVYAPFTVVDGGASDADGLANGTVVAQWQVPVDGSATGANLQVTATSGSQTATTTFSDAPNKIVSENQKPGTPESVWAIHGSISDAVRLADRRLCDADQYERRANRIIQD